MRRALAFLVRNWPLKLAAIVLAAVLYAGVVISQDTRSWPGQVPIEVVDPPAGGVLLAAPGAVTELRYRAPLDVAGGLRTDAFRATLDLSDVTPAPGAPAVEVPLELVALDPRVQVVEYAPRSVAVRMDTVSSRAMPVTVERGTPPEGYVLGPVQTDPGSVVLRGASTRIGAVAGVLARVAVDASGLNVDQVVDLDAVDADGALVPGVEVTPAQARVRFDVARQLAYAALPVVPAITGAPAIGYRLSAVSVEPATVTVSGEAPRVERLASVKTVPIPVDGLSSGESVTVPLLLPAEVSVIGDAEALVHLSIEPIQGSRTVRAGLAIQGLRRDRSVSLSTDSVQVTLAGPVALLEAAMSPEADPVVATLDLGGLGNGRHEVLVRLTPPDGLRVVSLTPRMVVARIAAPDRAPVVQPTPAPSTGALVEASPATLAPGATIAPAPAASVRPSGQAAQGRPAATPAASGGT